MSDPVTSLFLWSILILLAFDELRDIGLNFSMAIWGSAVILGWLWVGTNAVGSAYRVWWADYDNLSVHLSVLPIILSVIWALWTSSFYNNLRRCSISPGAISAALSFVKIVETICIRISLAAAFSANVSELFSGHPWRTNMIIIVACAIALHLQTGSVFRSISR